MYQLVCGDVYDVWGGGVSAVSCRLKDDGFGPGCPALVGVFRQIFSSQPDC
jgi:hypothetical protein